MISKNSFEALQNDKGEKEGVPQLRKAEYAKKTIADGQKGVAYKKKHQPKQQE